MNQKLLLFIISFVVFSCGRKENEIFVTGNYESPKQDYVYLELIDATQNLSRVDSFLVDDSGDFELSVIVDEPSFYRLNFYDRHVVNVILDDEDLQVKRDLNDPNVYLVENSKDTDHIYAVKAIQKEFEREIAILETRFIEARETSDIDKIQQIQSDFLKISKLNKDKIKEAIMNMNASIAGIIVANSYLQMEEDVSFFDSLSAKYIEEIPHSSYAVELLNDLKTYRSVSIGADAPAIELPNLEGDIVSLSSLQGNYVLIDFWAAWCGPCRRANPYLKKIYEKYSNKGFQILAVSLDRNRSQWLKAIEEDQLPWMHVSDLKYFESKAAEDYMITYIPSSFLIDPNGKIVAKNFSPDDLDKKLAEIYN